MSSVIIAARTGSSSSPSASLSSYGLLGIFKPRASVVRTRLRLRPIPVWRPCPLRERPSQPPDEDVGSHDQDTPFLEGHAPGMRFRLRRASRGTGIGHPPFRTPNEADVGAQLLSSCAEARGLVVDPALVVDILSQSASSSSCSVASTKRNKSIDTGRKGRTSCSDPT